MRKLAIAALLLAFIPIQAKALNVDNLLGLVAMPLAVAAVSDVNGVPADDLGNLIATLNQANVPPTQIVQVIRYVPVALVRNDQPTFVQYVSDQAARGVTGDALVTVIDQRLRTYDVTPQFVPLTEPATTFVVSDNYIPPSVAIPRDTNDLLALIAMPLAVNAVSNLTGVPQSDLASFVASLNQANVAPVQVVEVLRYAPVALVRNDEPRFVQFVQDQTAQGVVGDRLVTVIDQRIRTYDNTPRVIVRAQRRTVFVDDSFIPPTVVRRVAEVRTHPHGGPPGQLKKIYGLQTGAEVVHGTQPAPLAREVHVEHKHGRHGRSEGEVALPPPMVAAPPVVAVPPGQAKKHDGGGGKGKGHGKD